MSREPNNLGMNIRYSETRVVQVAETELLRRGIVVRPGTAGQDAAVDRLGVSFNMLRTQVLHRLTQKGWNTLAVTSPQANTGKTMSAINLAISMARELHHTVLLVDLDLRKPKMHEYFGFTPTIGIEDILDGSAELSSALVNPGIERLVMLPAKGPVWNSAELLASPAMAQLVMDLKSRYPSRFILFDMPPLLPTDDTIAFVPHVDCVLLVIEDGRTLRTDIERSVGLLNGASTPLLGTVLNKADVRQPTYP
ncbi:MAG: CpsD/CapB family tyrosine-protein kinase [Gammaproteobacteria bacterium]|nr:CpsD/CapB family tyrosine-protein kinase [Gammaproteobacteria bacterium]